MRPVSRSAPLDMSLFGAAESSDHAPSQADSSLDPGPFGYNTQQPATSAWQQSSWQPSPVQSQTAPKAAQQQQSWAASGAGLNATWPAWSPAQPAAQSSAHQPGAVTASGAALNATWPAPSPAQLAAQISAQQKFWQPAGAATDTGGSVHFARQASITRSVSPMSESLSMQPALSADLFTQSAAILQPGTATQLHQPEDSDFDDFTSVPSPQTAPQADTAQSAPAPVSQQQQQQQQADPFASSLKQATPQPAAHLDEDFAFDAFQSAELDGNSHWHAACRCSQPVTGQPACGKLSGRAYRMWSQGWPRAKACQLCHDSGQSAIVSVHACRSDRHGPLTAAAGQPFPGGGGLSARQRSAWLSGPVPEHPRRRQPGSTGGCEAGHLQAPLPSGAAGVRSRLAAHACGEPIASWLLGKTIVDRCQEAEHT